VALAYLNPTKETPMDWNTVLQQLSRPGVERPLGAGDVVPYQRTTTPGQTIGDQQTASDAVAATPGPSGTFGPAATPAASFDPNSFLTNLSSFMPLLNQLINQQNAAAVPSGQGNAQAQPAAQAVSGPSSADLGAMQPAGSPAPAGIAPSTAGPGSWLNGQWFPTYPAGYADSLSGGQGSTGAGPGAPGGPPGEGAPGAPGGTAGDASGGVGDGSGGVYKRGGLVTQGNPKSKTDDVNAKLQHGEFVIPREAMHHLAMTAPDVLSHVVQVSAAHAANAARGPQASPAQQLTGQNGMPPKPMHDGGPVGYRNGGLVLPAGVAPQIHPEVMNRIRQAIAMHAAPPVARPMVGPSQVAQMGPAMASQGRQPVLPPIAGPAV
jgi:hypothetical protein